MVAIIAGFIATQAQPLQKSTVTIYYGGNIVTMEGDKPTYVEAIAVKDGIITYVGKLSQAKNKYKKAQMHDLKNKTMLPGFFGPHLHFTGLGGQAISANLLAEPDGKVGDIPTLINTLKEWAKGPDLNRTGWIFGMGYDDAVLKEGRHPTKFDLDKVSTTLPVIAIHISGHFAVMNSVGLKMMGITAKTKDPKGGIIRRVKGSQEPNGVLEELAAIPAYMSIISPKKKDDIFYFLEKAQELAVSFGYTTVQEGRAFGDAHTNLVNYAKEKGFKLDVVSYLDYSMKDENVEGFSCSGNHINKAEKHDYVVDYSKMKSPWTGGRYSGGYRVAGMKITLDGSPQGRTAWSKTPYLVPPDGQKEGYSGYPAFSKDSDLEALFALAFKNNWQMLIHANGNAAIDQLIRVMKPVAKKYGNEDRRNVLVHGVFLEREQYADLKELHIIPSMFTMHTFYWGDWYKKIIGEKRAQRIAPAKSLLDAGFPVTIHTDAPVALPNLMQIVWASVNRVSRSGEVMGADECITPYQALKAITITSAYQHFEEKQKGSLKVGKLADLVILSDNPMTINPMLINKIQVMKTIKKGESIYRLK